MDIINKIKSSIRISSKKEISYDKRVIRPIKDWVTILIISQIIIFSGAIFAFYFYMQVDSGEFYKTTDNDLTNDVKINSALLKHTVDYVNEKEQRFANILQKETPRDPSI